MLGNLCYVAESVPALIPPVVKPLLRLNPSQAPDLMVSLYLKGTLKVTLSWQFLMPPPPHIFPTSSSSLGSISGLLDTQRSWIWLHSLGPTGANVLPSIHQAGWPQGGRLWSACADRRWMRNRGLLPIAIFLLIPSSATFPFPSCRCGIGVTTLCFSWRSHLPW